MRFIIATEFKVKRVSSEKISKELDKALYKKAIGYETNEVVEEYVCDEEGDFKLSKKKVTKKFISPDLQSVKVLLDKLNSTNTNKFKEFTDEDLLLEKKKLLEELEKFSD